MFSHSPTHPCSTHAAVHLSLRLISGLWVFVITFFLLFLNLPACPSFFAYLPFPFLFTFSSAFLILSNLIFNLYLHHCFHREHMQFFFDECAESFKSFFRIRSLFQCSLGHKLVLTRRNSSFSVDHFFLLALPLFEKMSFFFLLVHSHSEMKDFNLGWILFV